MSTSKNTVHKACMGCLGLLLLGPGAVRAQQGNTELEQIQRAQQRSIQQAQDIKLPQADVFVTPPADKSTQALDASPSGAQSPCIALRSFALLGHLPVMGEAPTLPVPPMCMDAQALNALLSRLNAHYQTLGWITTRVYIDPAEQANETLKLHVVPGRIEAYKLGNDEKDPRIKAAFPQRTANELNLRDLEQGLENINRLPSQQGQFKVLPGSENGQSIVQIDVQQKRSARVTEMVENSGTRSMGIWKSTTELALDNLAGLNDQLALGLISNLDRGDLHARFKGITFNYLVPRGYHLWSLSGSASIQADSTINMRASRLEQSGQISSAAAIGIEGDHIVNSGQTQGQQLQVQGQNLDNSGAMKALSGGLTLALSDQLNNHTGAQLLSQGNATLAATSLNNEGQITAANAIDMQVQNLRNSGQVQAQTQLQATARQLDNAGVLAAQNLNIDSQSLLNSGHLEASTLDVQAQQISNAGGQILAAQDLTLHAGQLDNRQGTIANVQGNVTLRAQQLDNRTGTILQKGGAGALSVQADTALNNASGHIEGQGATMNILAGEIGNNNGHIQHTATLQSGQPLPQLTLTAQASDQASGQLQNIQGTISATGHANIQAQAYITDASDKRLSQSQTLQFMDKAQAQSGSAPASNGYNWETDIAANTAVANAKSAADAAAATATTASTTLTQAQTSLSAAQTQKTQTSADLTQAQADLSAAQTPAQISAAQTALTQAQQADQQAQTNLSLAQTQVTTAQADKTAADAALASAQASYQSALAAVPAVNPSTSGQVGATDTLKPADLQLATPSAPVVTAPGAIVVVGGDLHMNLGSGGLDNRQGKLQASNVDIQTSGNAWLNQINAQSQLSVQAANIESNSLVHAQNARIVAAQQLNNTARIEGTQTLTLQAAQVQNTGTLYGPSTTVQASQSLLNAGLIQGQDTLVVDAPQVLNLQTLAGGQVTVHATQQLENTGTVFANTGMTLQSADIVNNQARIHSMGDLRLEGAQSASPAGSIFNYAGRIEAAGDLQLQATTITNRAILPTVNPRGLVVRSDDGVNIITRATDTFNADGKKAELIAGKNLNITAGTVHNDYGVISAWHQVNITANTLNNTAYGAIQTENMVVRAACFNCHQTVRYAASWGGVIESAGATTLRAQVINNRTTDTRDGFAGLSTDPRVVIVDERSGTQSPLTQAFVDRFGLVNGPASSSGNSRTTPQPAGTPLSDNLVLTAYGTFDFTRFKLPDGQSGLFQKAPASAPYLIQGRTDLIPRETGTQNTNYNQFLGSDYLLTRLGMLPGTAKRLGDAWYETQLVQEQLYALSGKRYVVANAGSDYELMRSLMDAGLLAQAQLSLSAGEPLSPAQQAALTQDMVWPEWQEVDGQRVLVPHVYLAKASVQAAAAANLG